MVIRLGGRRISAVVSGDWRRPAEICVACDRDMDRFEAGGFGASFRHFLRGLALILRVVRMVPRVGPGSDWVRFIMAPGVGLCRAGGRVRCFVLASLAGIGFDFVRGPEGAESGAGLELGSLYYCVGRHRRYFAGSRVRCFIFEYLRRLDSILCRCGHDFSSAFRMSFWL